jgi:hypothetical protein
MQLGTRWNVGDAAPARLSEAVVEAIRAAEAGFGEVDTAGWRWTLTWLEGRPVVELDPAPGAETGIVVIRVGHDGMPTTSVE